YAAHFASLDAAYQQVFRAAVRGVRTNVESLLRGLVEDVEAYEDFLVVNRKFTVLVQPSVPVLRGYSQYWYFRPDARGLVDITLGVREYLDLHHPDVVKRFEAVIADARG
ncbi:MAG: hypothetical protein ABSE73_32140, partial [Planctomycetota bacterium]